MDEHTATTRDLYKGSTHGPPRKWATAFFVKKEYFHILLFITNLLDDMAIFFRVKWSVHVDRLENFYPITSIQWVEGFQDYTMIGINPDKIVAVNETVQDVFDRLFVEAKDGDLVAFKPYDFTHVAENKRGGWVPPKGCPPDLVF